MGKCLDSIFALRLADEEREVIVVDDGSRQSPDTCVRRYGTKVRLYRKENGGPGAARNHGTCRASGEYVQYVDADDTLTDAYNQCLDILREEKPDILMFNSTRKGTIVSESGTDFMLHHNLRGAACGLAFRRAILRGLAYDTSLINEDELFNALLMLNAGKVVDAPIQAYNYEYREDSRSHCMSPDRLKRRLEDMETIICRLREESDSSSGQRREALRRRVSQLTMDYLYLLWKQTEGLSCLRAATSRLGKERLYPLPLRAYTWKYWLFALITKMVRI